MTRSFQIDSTGACPQMSEDLVLLLYDEASAAERDRIERHLSTCRGCRGELETLRATLRTIDQADLGGMASALARSHTSALWDPIAARLDSPVGAHPAPSRYTSGWWLKAAAAVVLAGGGFLAGAQFGSLQHVLPWPVAPLTAPEQPGQAVPGPSVDPDSRLRAFSERTGGYLNRSRLVLLEVANADTGSDSRGLNEIIDSLLRESREARRVADQIADPRIEELVVRLEAILRDISRLSDWGDAPSVERLRERVNASGMLEELELMVPTPARLAARRSRI